jgi:hypothetical protein
MITLLQLRLELLAMLIAPLVLPTVAWLAEYSFATRRQRHAARRVGGERAARCNW